LNSIIFVLLLIAYQEAATSGVLDGTVCVPHPADTYVPANAGGCCIGEYHMAMAEKQKG
jgi:hypothetical protein